MSSNRSSSNNGNKELLRDNCFVCPRCKRVTTEADMVYTEGNCIEYGNLCDYDELLCATIKQQSFNKENDND